jgi:hypothetical protein
MLTTPVSCGFCFMVVELTKVKRKGTRMEKGERGNGRE